MGGGGGRDRREEDRLRAAAEAAHREAEEARRVASTPDPLEERRRTYLTNFDKWRMGESGPIDVRNMPGAGLGISLFNEAKQSRDAGRLGRGLATLADGANPNFATALDKEMQMERDVNASGQLEDYVAGANEDVDREMLGVAQMGNQRRMTLAELASSLARGASSDYTSWLSRPKQPGFLKSLALGALGNLSIGGGGGAGGALKWAI